MATPREPRTSSSNEQVGGLRRDYTPAPLTYAYLLGTLHDATERKTTYRIGTKNYQYCLYIKRGILNLGHRAWVYKEGKNRKLWIVEFSRKFLSEFKLRSRQDKIDYIRGYFDTDGGISKSSSVRFYLYFAQKDQQDLLQVRSFLQELNISCGKMHNPSKKVDPDYWRFYISAKSISDFAKIVGSAHPGKQRLLRMKI